MCVVGKLTDLSSSVEQAGCMSATTPLKGGEREILSVDYLDDLLRCSCQELVHPLMPGEKQQLLVQVQILTIERRGLSHEA